MDILERELAFLDKNKEGYKMLEDVIRIAASADGKVVLSTNIFPQIAKKYNKTSAGVERDIRYLLKKGECKLSSKKFIKSVVQKLAN